MATAVIAAPPQFSQALRRTQSAYRLEQQQNEPSGRIPSFAGRTWVSDGVRAALCHTPKFILRSSSSPNRDLRGAEWRSAWSRSSKSPDPSLCGDSNASFRLFDNEGAGGSQASARPPSYRTMLRAASTSELPPYARSTQASESKRRSTVSDATLRSRSTTATSATGSRNASQDHLWRELSHDDVPDPQQATRLVGDSAKAIGRRGRESKGIPWRQIPSYGRHGQLTETGDPFMNADVIRRVSHVQKFKGVGSCSPRLSSSAGASECISSRLSDETSRNANEGDELDQPEEEEEEVSRSRAASRSRRRTRETPRSSLPLDHPDDSIDGSEPRQAHRPLRRMVLVNSGARDTCPFGLDVPHQAKGRLRTSHSPLPPPRHFIASPSLSPPRGGRCAWLAEEMRRIQGGTTFEPGHRFNLFNDEPSGRRSPSPIC